MDGAERELFSEDSINWICLVNLVGGLSLLKSLTVLGIGSEHPVPDDEARGVVSALSQKAMGSSECQCLYLSDSEVFSS